MMKRSIIQENMTFFNVSNNRVSKHMRQKLTEPQEEDKSIIISGKF